MEHGCVLWGNCIIVPAQGRPQVNADLHEAHVGISRMKGFALLVCLEALHGYRVGKRCEELFPKPATPECP